MARVAKPVVFIVLWSTGLFIVLYLYIMKYTAIISKGP